VQYKIFFPPISIQSHVYVNLNVFVISCIEFYRIHFFSLSLSLAPEFSLVKIFSLAAGYDSMTVHYVGSVRCKESKSWMRLHTTLLYF
jgi:hypothetical protein